MDYCIDDLILKGLKILQHQKQFKFAIDAVMLAHFVTVKKEQHVIDLGTGTGVIPLILWARGTKYITGVEINPQVVKLATESVKINNLTDSITILEGDVRNIRSILPAGKAELVVTNPPYFKPSEGKINPNLDIASARHELNGDLEDFIKAAAYLVKYRGYVAMIHTASRLAEIIKALQTYKLEPKRLRLIYPKPNKEADLILIEAVKGGSVGLKIMPPLFIYDNKGNYTEEILAWYKGD